MTEPAVPLPYARVVVDVPTRALPEPFDYAVPAALDAVAAVGAPVLVPFGPKKQSGWIVQRTDTPGCDPSIVKPIADVTGQPLFDETAARLALWVADRYLAPPSEALRLVLPPGQARRVERWVRLAVDPADLISDEGAVVEVGGRRVGGLERELITWLAVREEAEVGEVTDLFGPKGLAALKRLVAAGVAAEDTRLQRARVGAKTVEWIELAMPVDDALEAVGARAAKQRSLVEALADGPRATAELLDAAGAGRAALLALAGKGAVRLVRREVERGVDTSWSAAEPSAHTLEPEQASALAALEAALGSRDVFCLEGVTGSGKSEVYLRLIETARDRGMGAIVLVPEISLTPQTVGRFSDRFGDSVAVLHSRLSPGERYDQWRSLATGARSIVVGARSALFAPVRPLGVVVLDEEHDGSFKQESSPRYHAREAAIELGRLTGAIVVLGSATPSLETIRYVEDGAARRLHLSKRVAGRSLPEITIADMAAEFRDGNRSILSSALRAELERCMGAGEKAILLINRRGWAGFVLCRDCGHVPKCPHCEVSLTVHLGDSLRCHHCGHVERMPRDCPACTSPFLRTFGIGTQRVEEVLRLEYPDVPVVRMDADTTKGRHGHHRLLRAFADADTGILVGTQMVAKGHDFPEVSLVGVVAADIALHLPDFRAAERTYQLLHQVAGRAGRGDVPGKVVVQTYCPDHYAIAALPTWRLDDFYVKELGFRRELGYPPYGALINLIVSGRDAEEAAGAARTVAEALAVVDAPAADALALGVPAGIEIVGPVAAALSKLAGNHRWQLVVKGPEGETLRTWLGPKARELRAKLPKTISLAVDVDPLWLM